MTVEPGLYVAQDEDGDPMLLLVIRDISDEEPNCSSVWVYGMRTSIDPLYSDALPRRWVFTPEFWRKL